MERTGNGDLAFGNGDKMNVVCHQDIRPDANTMFLAAIFERSKVDETIGLIMKNSIFSNTTVTNVMSILRNNAPTRSCHMK